MTLFIADKTKQTCTDILAFFELDLSSSEQQHQNPKFESLSEINITFMTESNYNILLTEEP